MIVNAAREGFTRRVMLFYSNRRPEDCAFLQELQQIGSGNKNCQTICVMTKMEESQRSWHGETGYINKSMLARFAPDVAAPIYYIAGPPALVTAMQETLNGAG